MNTQKVVLREVEEFMADYTPIYQPLYPLFIGRSAQYTREAGKLDFRRVRTIGDIRAKHVTPKDTEIRQVSVMEGKKTFKKYFLANQFTLSDFQDRQGVEEIVSQVLDEHQVQMDELFLLGEGSGPGSVLNNGLFYSSDPNYNLQSSEEIALSNRLYDLHSRVMTDAQTANQIGGRKVVIFYGTDIIPLVNSLFPDAVRSFKAALQESLGPDYSIVEMPAASTPSGENGWIIANFDQCKFHYTALPQLLDQGSNQEKMYLWMNFLMGSCMLEVLAKDAVIRQPTTLESA